MKQSTRWLIVLLAALGLAGLDAPVQACNVPVFRYALERWRPDAYELVLYHRGALSEADKQAVDLLNDQIDDVGHNVTLTRVDLDGTLDERQQAIYDQQKDPQLPWLVVRYPEHLRINADVWCGKFTQDTIKALLDSPVRHELTKRILSGETAVWLLLEGEDAAENIAARERIEAEIKRLAAELKLPELTDSPEDEIATGGPPLKIAFSVLPISRTDEREEFLRKILIGSEPDLAERRDPMVFPVFGRGRALLPLIGPGITAENIADAAGFLTGPCSCQVKELNPGFDLVLANRFDEVIGSSLLTDMLPPAELGEEVAIPPGPASPASTPPAASASAAAAPAATTAAPQTAQTVEVPLVVEYSIAPRPTWARLLIFGGGFLLLFVVLASLAVLFSSRSKQQGS